MQGVPGYAVVAAGDPCGQDAVALETFEVGDGSGDDGVVADVEHCPARADLGRCLELRCGEQLDQVCCNIVFDAGGGVANDLGDRIVPTGGDEGGHGLRQFHRRVVDHELIH